MKLGSNTQHVKEEFESLHVMISLHDTKRRRHNTVLKSEICNSSLQIFLLPFFFFWLYTMSFINLYLFDQIWKLSFPLVNKREKETHKYFYTNSCGLYSLYDLDRISLISLHLLVKSMQWPFTITISPYKWQEYEHPDSISILQWNRLRLVHKKLLDLMISIF